MLTVHGTTATREQLVQRIRARADAWDAAWQQIPPRLAVWPAVDFIAWQELPPHQGVYLVVDTSGHVLYVGATQNLQQRWRRHHKASALMALKASRIAYWLHDRRDVIAGVERHFIANYKPILNEYGFTLPSGRSITGTRHQVMLTRADRCDLADWAQTLPMKYNGEAYTVEEAVREAALRYLQSLQSTRP